MAAERLHRPSDLRLFLKSCGVIGEGQTKEEKKTVDKILKEMASMFKGQLLSVGEEQGTEQFLRNSELMAPSNLEAGEDESCRKNVGDQVRLRRYNRGIFAACSGGGHIWSFDVLYHSESPTQVSMAELFRFLYLYCSGSS